MSDYADTSVLVSYLTPDGGSNAAHALLLSRRSRILVTEWVGLEFENAVNLRRFRGGADERDVVQWISCYQHELDRGLFDLRSLDYSATVHKARELIAAHTYATGARTLDVLHVAAAMLLGAECFLTLDQRQAALARRAGLRVAG